MHAVHLAEAVHSATAALTASPATSNKRAGTCICCPDRRSRKACRRARRGKTRIADRTVCLWSAAHHMALLLPLAAAPLSWCPRAAILEAIYPRLGGSTKRSSRWPALTTRTMRQPDAANSLITLARSRLSICDSRYKIGNVQVFKLSMALRSVQFKHAISAISAAAHPA